MTIPKEKKLVVVGFVSLLVLGSIGIYLKNNSASADVNSMTAEMINQVSLQKNCLQGTQSEPTELENEIFGEKSAAYNFTFPNVGIKRVIVGMRDSAEDSDKMNITLGVKNNNMVFNKRITSVISFVQPGDSSLASIPTNYGESQMGAYLITNRDFVVNPDKDLMISGNYYDKITKKRTQLCQSIALDSVTSRDDLEDDLQDDKDSNPSEQTELE